MKRGIENNKTEYRSKIKNINDNMTRQRYKQRKHRKNYRKVPEFRKIKENIADIK